ncbi:hypothetical protein PhCBS80983_g05245 [Powellomyces hirtus]|uniref:NAD(P)-binding domain-containing protein n=1 Tax=Powellomyces hirtus TaxID=109895 RepID=A0A507DVN1_9FUNG|nr:hypothetical protein PhCBS80983_g05245 [Powellomyces hirtus]
MSTTVPRVLVLGGNGNVAKLMTRLMLAKGWHVISVIRAPSQSASLSISLGSTNSGHLDFRTVDFLSTTSSSAKDLLQDVRPDIIVWAAASMSQPRQIDGAAAKAYTAAGASLPTVKKILSISAYSARRKAAPWWSKADAEYWKHEVTSYPDIANAKTDADEHLIAWGNKRAREGDATFQAIAVRPVWYGSGGNGSEGKVVVGKTPARGTVRREDVASIAVALLERSDARGYFDVAGGGTLAVEKAVQKAVEENVDAIEGEDVERISALVS